MTPEQMTNEELIEGYFQGKCNACDHVRLGHEIERRLRNSIPKPRVEFIDDTLTVNGKYVACDDSEYAVNVYENLLVALTQGGGDDK